LFAIFILGFKSNDLPNLLYKGMGGEKYQRDVDILRLNDLKEIGGYLNEYKEKTEKYPFEDKSDVPVYVHIATKEQRSVKMGKPPYRHIVIPVTDLIAELEKVLKRDVLMPFDPQRKPNGRPNFYVYMITKGTYFLGVHLYHPYSFAQKIRPNWYKVEISNRPNPQLPIWKYKDLISNEDFKTTIKTPLKKPGYFRELIEKIRNEGPF
jgi:hypothetical protein